MKLSKALLYAGLLLSVPACKEDTLTKQQAIQAVQRQYSYHKLGYSHAVTDEEHYPYKDIKLAMDHYDTSETEDITPLVEVVNKLSKKYHFPINPVLQDLESKIRQDSGALVAVAKGNYTVKRGHPSGYDVFVRCATTTPDSLYNEGLSLFPCWKKVSKIR
jgi:hypothetical protein